MQWSELRGHSQQREWFETALARGRLASSFLFVGQEGIGKHTFARLLAKSLLCRGSDPTRLEHCGTCEDCVQVAANTHPDLLQVSKPAEKAFLPIELLIGEREKRMRAGLCHDIALKPYSGLRKVAIIDDADTLNNEGANCLLKTLEEPPNRSLIILISSGLQRQLPTIRSRCQTLLFRPLSDADVEAILPQAWESLQDAGVDSKPLAAEQVASIASQSGGSICSLRLMTDEDFQEFQSTLLSMLARPQLPIADLIKSCGGIVDAAGKDNRVKRDRMRSLFELAGRYFRWMALCLDADMNGTDVAESPALQNAVEGALAHWRVGSEGAVRCWNRCLLAVEQVDRNANQAALFEAWSSDIAAYSQA